MINERQMIAAAQMDGPPRYEKVQFDVEAAIAENDAHAVWLLVPDIAKLEHEYHVKDLKGKICKHFKGLIARRDLDEAIRAERRNSAVVAISSAKRPDWAQQLIRNESGAIKTVFANVVTILENAEEFQGVLRYNEFAAEVWAGKAPPWKDAQSNCPWKNTEDLEAWHWIQTRYNLHVGLEVVGYAVQIVARRHSFHPVRDYLLGLKWDGTPRIDTWLTDYLGVDPHDKSDFVREAGSKWLISAVARAMRPGAKADYCLVLQGTQGIKKSTAIRHLVPNEKWFTDHIDTIGSKDSSMQCNGVWIIEVAEFSAIKKAEVENIKSFMSRTEDRFRPPYGKHVEIYPRQCVFAGSVNPATFLKDDTGSRRFWPFTCPKSIDVEVLKNVRDQLWAEALFRYDEGDTWYIDPATPAGAQATEEQEARYIEQPYDSRMEDFEDKQRELAPIDAEELIVRSQDFFDFIKLEPHSLGPAQTHMMASAFRSAKWEVERRWVINENTGEKQRKRVWVKKI